MVSTISNIHSIENIRLRQWLQEIKENYHFSFLARWNRACSKESPLHVHTKTNAQEISRSEYK